MIPATEIREVTSKGVQSKGVFAISMTNQAHIMTILRDTLYSDKELAVLREYSSNAWDAHREVGKGDVPIKVHLPTEMEPSLVIRDFGPGLSEHDVFNVFTQYGESTKRDTDNAVGMLGIGSKSGFAYSESFSITSWHGGEKAIYVAYLDPSDKGEINKIASIPCDPSETGLEITISVQSKDIDTFRRKATDLFRYFEPRPNINIPLPEAHRSVTKHGFIASPDKDSMREWIALMGCVPYRLELSQIRNELYDLGIYDTLFNLHGGIYFDIGEVQISASREELKYSDKTKAAIIAKLQALLEEYVEGTLSALKAEGISGWDKRLKVQFLSDSLHLPIPKVWQEYTKKRVTLFGEEKPKTFTLATNHSSATSLPVGSRVSVYFRDTDKPLKGYGTYGDPVFLLPVDSATREEVIAEFEALCLAAECDGVKVNNISALSWSAYHARSGKATRVKTVNRKHHIRSFKLKTDVGYHSPWSATWEIVKREPQDDDQFVVIQDFKAVDWDAFHSTYQQDLDLAQRLGVTLPPVYGYKTTAKKAITKADCKGTHYRKWRIAFFRSLITPEHREIARIQGWVDLLQGGDEPYSYRLRGQVVASDMHKFLSLELGSTHPCTMLFQRVLDGREAYRKVSGFNQNLIKPLLEASQETSSEAMQARAALFERYPLLGDEGFGGAFGGEARPLWIDYIKLVDRDCTTPVGKVWSPKLLG